MEGRQAVRELLAVHRREVTEIWLTEGNDPSPILGEIDRLAREAHVPVRLVSPRRLESVQGTETPQGVVAFAEPLTAVSLDELVLGHADTKRPTVKPRSTTEVDDDLADFEDFDVDEDEEEDEEDEDFDIFIDVDDFEPAGESDDEEDADSGSTSDEIADSATEEPSVPVGIETVDDAPHAESADAEADVESPAADISPADAEADVESPAADISPAAAEAVEALDRAGWVSDQRAAESTTSVDEPSATAFLIVLEGVTDPQNLGAILRTAECAGATGVAVPRHRSVHVTPAVTKAAAGAIEHLPMALVAGVPSALQELERLGVMTVGFDERGTSSLFDLNLGDRPVALVLGSEGTGLSSLARRRCDVLCRIPVAGAIPSLNVSAAAAVACFEVARQRASRS